MFMFCTYDLIYGDKIMKKSFSFSEYLDIVYKKGDIGVLYGLNHIWVNQFNIFTNI